MFFLFFWLFSTATYLMLFGPTLKPLFLRTLAWPSIINDKLGAQVKHKSKEGMDKVSPLLHTCTLMPDVVRDEVETLKTDFNNRVKQVLFNSMLTAYYMAFVPLCFAQVILMECLRSFVLSFVQVSFLTSGLVFVNWVCRQEN